MALSTCLARNFFIPLKALNFVSSEPLQQTVVVTLGVCCVAGAWIVNCVVVMCGCEWNDSLKPVTSNGRLTGGLVWMESVANRMASSG